MQTLEETSLPDFSIITPTFRRPLLLERNINSVIHQTYKNYEHIIIDDANDPETGRLINKIKDPRIIYQQHSIPKGAAGAYNSGIEISRGKFILFLDDDDEYMPSFLEKMLNHFLRADHKVGFIWTGISRIKDTDEGEKFLYSNVWPSHFPTKEAGLVAATSIGNGFGVCVRRECIDLIGKYDESLMIGEDTDFLFRLVKKFDFETIPEVLVKIHQHGTAQLTNEKNYRIRLEQREVILQRHFDLLNEFPKVYCAHFKAVADLCYNLKLRRKGRMTMFSILKKSHFRLLNFADIFFYQFTGKDTTNFYQNSRLKRVVYLLKQGVQSLTINSKK